MSERTDGPAEALSNRVIVTTRAFDAPRDLVFKAWIDPEHLARWWGPKGFTNTFQEFATRPNGVWRFVMHGPDGVDSKNKGVFVETVKPARQPLNATRSRSTPSRRTSRTSTASRRNQPRSLDTQATYPEGDGAMSKKTLYERLGGYDAISAVVNDLLPRLQADTQLARFWQHRGEDGVRREQQLLIDFLCSSAGGPLYYTGRDMKSSHRGMKISERDWSAFLGHLRATLEAFRVPQAERDEVVAFIQSTKPDIVEA